MLSPQELKNIAENAIIAKEREEQERIKKRKESDEKSRMDMIENIPYWVEENIYPTMEMKAHQGVKDFKIYIRFPYEKFHVELADYLKSKGFNVSSESNWSKIRYSDDTQEVDVFDSSLRIQLP